ncbi:uncharacterized protein YbjT (DUF2867 family) [Leucobacter komagatae]|uniref:Uncharacterized protein YbjT (DUF2867 family) n=1 Tax=Leucobacter komagatae TaxID=55969 RepID=A0A542Y2S5_9MICO|nr:NAD(P)H-binding protein [Leucobacter komagatae]TQL42361.1 uncharacterized protein YbjT (DUF2867 family) [Leucobacter komagatae]
MRTVVHGATGAQGSPVVAALVALGEEPIALSRSGKPVPGARALAVDATSESDLTEAYTGADAVFIHLPMAPQDELMKIAGAATAAVKAARPGRVVISTSGVILGAPGTPLQAPADSPLAELVDGVTATGIPTAVIEPRLFLENLLLPHIQAGIREDGVLRYPIREDFAVSWASHLDVAEAIVGLLRDPSVTGVVGVGHLPPVKGADLAAAFSEALGTEVAFEAITPAEFGAQAAPILGEGPAAGVVGFYTALQTEPAFTFDATVGAAALVGVSPMPLATWAKAVTAS